MSSVRICQACKWEYPESFHHVKCKFCKAVFDTQFCIRCKQFLPKDNFYFYKNGSMHHECLACSKARWWKAGEATGKERQIRLNTKRRAEAEAKYREWQANAVSFKPLSESEWLEACAFFGGCAICGSPDIETRQFFVGFQHGGRYAPWNVFPACNKCSIYTRRLENPFVWLDGVVGQTRHMGMTEETRQRMLEYLTIQIEKAGDKA